MSPKSMKTWPACVVFAIASVTASVAQSADAPSPCASVTDDKSRLQCYDAEAALRARNASRAPETTAPTPASAPAPAATVAAPAPAPAPVAAAPPVPSMPTSTAAASSSPPEFGKLSMSAKQRKADDAASSEREQMSARVTGVSKRLTGDYRIELGLTMRPAPRNHGAATTPPGSKRSRSSSR
jgi:hypothetical protein